MKRILINSPAEDQKNLAFLEDDILEEFHRIYPDTLGNIYKGIVKNIHPHLEGAFLKITPQEEGFLPFSEILLPPRERYRKKIDPAKFLKVGDELLVQVRKEGFLQKPPLLSMRIALEGIALVLLPLSREKTFIEKMLTLPRKFLKEELSGLISLWGKITSTAMQIHAPSLIYSEDPLIKAIKRYFIGEVPEIVVDQEKEYTGLLKFFEENAPWYNFLRYYRESLPIFERFGIASEINTIYHREVKLPSGGNLIFEPCQTLTAIDVNSGRFFIPLKQDEMAFKVNMEAASEIPRQIRLRDLCGLIVINFIAMKKKGYSVKVVELLRKKASKDRRELLILPISKLSLVELSRERERYPFVREKIGRS
jgi:ribonuclease E